MLQESEQASILLQSHYFGFSQLKLGAGNHASLYLTPGILPNTRGSIMQRLYALDKIFFIKSHKMLYYFAIMHAIHRKRYRFKSYSAEVVPLLLHILCDVT